MNKLPGIGWAFESAPNTSAGYISYQLKGGLIFQSLEIIVGKCQLNSGGGDIYPQNLLKPEGFIYHKLTVK